MTYTEILQTRVEIFSRTQQKNTTRPSTGWIGATAKERTRLSRKLCKPPKWCSIGTLLWRFTLWEGKENAVQKKRNAGQKSGSCYRPRDRKGEFEPQLLKKHPTSIRQDIEKKILSMYAKGVTANGDPKLYHPPDSKFYQVCIL